MDIMLAQLFGEGDPLYMIVSWVFFIIMILFMQKAMMKFTIFKLEKDVIQLEEIAKKTKKTVSTSIPNKKDLKKNVDSFMEFFSIMPIQTDPYGIMGKIDHLVKNSERRFMYFVKQVAPKYSEEEQFNLKNALAGAMTTYQIAKVARHFLEMTKKYKLIQLALILQMQIPLIARIAKAAEKATESFLKGIPIGDGIGPLVAASMMRGRVKIYNKEEFAVSETMLAGRKVLIAKAKGPGSTTGYPGKLLLKLFKNKKINRIITIDAGLRLEGEKVGKIAQGVGVAIGGIGVDRYEIEQLAVKKDIPLDAVVVKVSDEEALIPMKLDILKSVNNATAAVRETVLRGRKNEKILIIGVGNTCGIGNDPKSIKETEKKVRNYARRQKGEKKQKKKYF
jgi:hypothetical protein